MTSWTQVGLDRLDWQDGTDLNVAARDVHIRLDPFSALFGGSLVREIAIGSIAFRLGDAEHPFPSPEALLARVRQAAGLRTAPATAATSPAPAFTPARSPARRRRIHLPLVRLDALSGQVHCRPFGDATVEGGWITVATPDDTVAGTQRRIEGGLDLTLAGDAARHLALSGRIAGGLETQWVSATSIPAITFSLAGGEARLSGVHWSDDALTFLEPAWRQPDRVDAEARSVTIRWDPSAAGTTDLTWLPDSIPQRLRDTLGRISLRELEVVRPTVRLHPGPMRTPAEPGPDEAPAKAPVAEVPDLRSRMVTLYQTLERPVVAVLGSAESVARRLPPARLAVQGARILFEPAAGEGQTDNTLSHLSLSVTKRDDGHVQARLRFETPEGHPGDDEIQATFDPATRTLSVSLRAASLSLLPYRGFLPARVAPTPDSRIGPADLVATAVIPDTLQVGGAITFTDLALDLPAVASTPLGGVALRLEGNLAWDLKEARIETRDAAIGVGRIQFPLTAQASHLREAPRLHVDATMTRIGAQQALESMPTGLLPALEGVRLSGTVAASGSLRLDTADLSGMRFEVVPDVADMTTVSLGKAAGVELLKTHFLHRIERADKTIVSRIVGDVSPEWVSLDAVPGHLIAALTTSEDAEFFRHQGFSREGIRRSLRVNLERGGFYQGASTLSQQLVKNLFLSREKTLSRKLQEAFLTWQVEQYLTKEKILELYLNVIEWGPGIWGIGAAARHYFGKAPAALTLLESAYLVSVIPAPSRHHAHWEAGAVPRAFEQRVKRLVREMQRRGLVEAFEADVAAEQTLRLASPNRATDPVVGPDEEDIPDDEFWD